MQFRGAVGAAPTPPPTRPRRRPPARPAQRGSGPTTLSRAAKEQPRGQPPAARSASARRPLMSAHSAPPASAPPSVRTGPGPLGFPAQASRAQARACGPARDAPRRAGSGAAGPRPVTSPSGRGRTCVSNGTPVRRPHLASARRVSPRELREVERRSARFTGGPGPPPGRGCRWQPSGHSRLSPAICRCLGFCLLNGVETQEHAARLHAQRALLRASEQPVAVLLLIAACPAIRHL